MPRVTDYIVSGTLDNVTFYRRNGVNMCRIKSSLESNRVKTSAEFQKTMLNAEILGRASKLASSLYKTLPAEIRNRKTYQKLTGEIIKWLKSGHDEHGFETRYPITELTRLLA